MSNLVIPIGADHAGFNLKARIIKHLVEKGFEIKDFGCYSEESIDYPDFGHPVASMVEENKEMKGILICGSGNGINMTANKHQDIRSALCWKKEIAELVPSLYSLGLWISTEACRAWRISSRWASM